MCTVIKIRMSHGYTYISFNLFNPQKKSLLNAGRMSLDLFCLVSITLVWPQFFLFPSNLHASSNACTTEYHRDVIFNQTCSVDVHDFNTRLTVIQRNDHRSFASTSNISTLFNLIDDSCWPVRIEYNDMQGRQMLTSVVNCTKSDLIYFGVKHPLYIGSQFHAVVEFEYPSEYVCLMMEPELITVYRNVPQYVVIHIGSIYLFLLGETSANETLQIDGEEISLLPNVRSPTGSCDCDKLKEILREHMHVCPGLIGESKISPRRSSHLPSGMLICMGVMFTAILLVNFYVWIKCFVRNSIANMN